MNWLDILSYLHKEISFHYWFLGMSERQNKLFYDKTTNKTLSLLQIKGSMALA